MKYAKWISLFILSYYFICLVNVIFLVQPQSALVIIKKILAYSILPVIMLLSLKWNKFFTGVIQWWCFIFGGLAVIGLYFHAKKIEYSSAEYIIFSIEILYYFIVGALFSGSILTKKT